MVSDQQLAEEVAKVWVDGGGDVDGLYWAFDILKAAVIAEIESRNEQATLPIL